VYRLEKSALEQAARRLRAQDPFPSATSETEAGAYERKVWHDFLTPEGRLKTIPAQRKKLDIILRRLAQEFQPGVRYPEKLVNEILKNYHDDTARLRRELIGARLLQREHGEYWRVEENEL
jgi:hypothetical protein